MTLVSMTINLIFLWSLNRETKPKKKKKCQSAGVPQKPLLRCRKDSLKKKNTWRKGKKKKSKFYKYGNKLGNFLPSRLKDF